MSFANRMYVHLCNAYGSQKQQFCVSEVLQPVCFVYVVCVHSELDTKAKQSLYMPGRTRSVQEVEASRFQGNWHKKCKLVSPLHRPPLHPRKYSWFLFLLDSESSPRAKVGPKVLCQRIFPMTLPGIETATFRLVAEYLNKLRLRVPCELRSAFWHVIWEHLML